MWRPQRKDIFFVVGMLGIALEEARAFGEPSEALLLLFAGMIGLPFVIRADEARREGENPSPPDGTKSEPSLNGETP